ncbi:MAG TPA: efflux RND transporter periplasmic adaptor subunit [Verrucomicrobiales bacterium]|nr:efflux RND transporter periplasmic adaptor subunit [Verrucomicrobiales bacterium]
MKTFFIILLISAAAAAGWFLRPHLSESGKASDTPGRKVLYYQSAMHPWIKSDKPGRCTICGMELTPVYEGQKGFDSASGDTIALTPSQIHVLDVQTSDARIQPLTRTLHVAGVIDDDARRHRLISAWVDGRVEKLYANHHGIEVVEGTPLALIYSPALLQAEREYRQLSGDLKKTTALRLRQMGLTDAQIEALPQKPADTLTSEILAPLTGTVVQHDIYEGQYVTTGQKLFEIADFSIMWFNFLAYEQDMPWIKTGQTVSVTTPSQPGRTFEGKITFIDPNFDEATRSTKVRVELANPPVDGRRPLLHRLYADGAVKVDAPDTLTIPKPALLQTGPEAVVYVDQGGGAYERRVVQPGRRGDALVEILSGLKAGEKVVTNGNLLIDGQAEMNRSFTTHPEPPASAAPPSPSDAGGDTLTAPQQQALSDFIKLADAMAATLSADDLGAFNKASGPAMEQTASLTESLQSRTGLAPALKTLTDSSHFHGFDDLKKARTAFHAFTSAAAPVMESLRAVKGVPAFNIWECSMVDQAIPGAPRKGRWVQVAGRAGANPFFGKEMLDCASEIKP